MDALQLLKPSKRKRQKRRDKRLKEELIECYRVGSYEPSKKKGYKKRMVGKDFQYSPKQEGVKIMSGGVRIQTDNLNPLKRYLNSKEGKYWNKVYSELCQKLDKNTMLGKHVFEHLFDFVETKVEINNGRIYGLNDVGRRELFSTHFWPKFYVHPKSGVLLKVKKRRNNKIVN